MCFDPAHVNIATYHDYINDGAFLFDSLRFHDDMQTTSRKKQVWQQIRERQVQLLMLKCDWIHMRSLEGWVNLSYGHIAQLYGANQQTTSKQLVLDD